MRGYDIRRIEAGVKTSEPLVGPKGLSVEPIVPVPKAVAVPIVPNGDLA